MKKIGILISVVLFFLTIIIIFIIIFKENKEIEANDLNKDNIVIGLSFENQDNLDVKNIINANETKEYAYNIKSCGGEVYVLMSNNEKILLREALLNNIINMNDIIEQAESDVQNNKIENIMYQDGGSKEYRYQEYTIIKLNKLPDLNNERNIDVYITAPQISISDLNI